MDKDPVAQVEFSERPGDMTSDRSGPGEEQPTTGRLQLDRSYPARSFLLVGLTCSM
jgi:hypothetical protein